jgi:trigger factor
MTEPKPWLRELEIEVEPDRVRKKIDATLDQLETEAEIPGFRKGHAPRALLERRLSSEIESQVAGELLREAYEEAVKEKGLRPLDSGRVSDYELTSEKVLRFKLQLEVLPEFELKDYSGIPVKKTEPTGFDAEFERRLNQRREMLATYTPVSRPSQDGDYLYVDFRLTDETGKEIDKRTNVMLRVGDSKNLPELNQALAGLNAGDEKDVDARVPDNYQDANFAGKSLRYHLGVRSIKTKSLPEVDEDLAQMLGFDSLDQMRERLNEEILADRKREVEADLLNQIYQHLVKAHDFEPPPSLVDEVYQQLITSNNLTDTTEVKEKLTPVAQAKARFQIVIARIAQQEKLEVTDAERDKVIDEYRQHAGDAGAELEVLKTRESFRYRLLEDKVMHHLLAKAQVS